MGSMIWFLKGFMGLLRPFEWTKSFGNMLIAFIVASGFSNFDWALFLAGFLAVGPFLWGGLYALNDFTDWQKDRLHPVKKSRAIPSGRVSPNLALALSLAMIGTSFLIGFFVVKNIFFVLCLAAMLANQFLYTLKPFEFKKKPVLDLISGSLINPYFRFFAGWFLVSSSFNAPLELIAFILAVQFGGYTLYRLSSKKHEEELDYKSSVVVFGEQKIKVVSYIAIVIGGIAFFAATLNGVLPQKYLWLGLLCLIPFPLYFRAMTNPQKMNMKKMYRLIYTHYTFFIIGFVAMAYL